MQAINPYNNTPNFTARCVQIRDAQWVCHTINSTFTHNSTTRMHSAIAKLYDKTFKTPKEFELMDLAHLRRLLHMNMPTKEEMQFLPYHKRLIIKLSPYFSSKEQKHNVAILHSAKEFIDKLAKLRTHYSNQDDMLQIQQCMEMCLKHKIANCNEDAVIAEFVLKLNGIKNATYAYMRDGKNRKSIDHAVCIFNRDGSKFNGEITKHTIVVDPWAGVADFATNISSFYRNQLSKHIKIAPNARINYEPLETVYFTENQYAKMRERFPKLIFPNKSREFMQNKKLQPLD